MSFFQKFSQLSSRGKSWWLLGLIIIFSFAVFLVSGGYYYNNFSQKLSEKTNNIIVLPQVKELPFSLGLDLQGGAQLVYQADVANIPEADRAGAMESARDVIERRVNAFGISEPLVQVNRGGNGEYRIIVELAGIKDVKEANEMIGQTPVLEFKEMSASDINLMPSENGQATAELDLNSNWQNTELTGKYLKRASLQFNPNDASPEVSLEFNDEGSKFFEDITARNIGQPVAIFLDGYPISVPTVNEKISGGQAVISGKFNVEEAKLLVKRLNSGALPVPISLISQKTVEASLGSAAIANSLQAGFIGLILVSLFMILYYRLPGLLSVLSLAIYGLTVLAIFKAIPVWLALVLVVIMVGLLFYSFNEMKIFGSGLALLFSIIGILLFFYALKPITLTLSGIAGFILSIGIAVDANILIFARMREELREGKTVSQAADAGFRRAWPSIRDGNISTIVTCLVLMFFGSSSVQGFGTTLFIGIAISLFSAIVVTRVLFVIILGEWLEKRPWLLGVSRRREEAEAK